VHLFSVVSRNNDHRTLFSQRLDHSLSRGGVREDLRVGLASFLSRKSGASLLASLWRRLIIRLFGQILIQLSHTKEAYSRLAGQKRRKLSALLCTLKVILSCQALVHRHLPEFRLRQAYAKYHYVQEY
jgi:hypothetical protein